MNKIIITTLSTNLNSNKRLIVEAKKLDLELVFCTPLEFKKMPPMQGIDGIIIRYSGINFDDTDLEHTRNWETNVYNSPDLHFLLRDKLKQSYFFDKFDIPHIPFLPLSQIQKLNILNSNQYIVKTIRGNKGIGQWKCETKDDVHLLYNDFKNKNDLRYIIQPFLVDQTEYRFLILNGKIKGIIEKTKSNHWQNNAQYCEFKFLSTSPSSVPIEIIKKFQSIHPCYFVAFDFFRSNNDHWKLIEVNATPGFQEYENVSNQNIANDLLLSLKNN